MSTALLVGSVGCVKDKTSENNSTKNVANLSDTDLQGKRSVGKEKNVKETNIEKMLNMLENTNKKTKFSKNNNYGHFLANVLVGEEEELINPYTRAKDIDVADKRTLVLDRTDKVLVDCSGSIIVICDDHAFLKNIEKSEITYGCNEANKGMVMSFVFNDGYYLYEVDKTGNKINDMTYIFPGYEYPDYANKK